jgi:hypothetical protein
MLAVSLCIYLQIDSHEPLDCENWPEGGVHSRASLNLPRIPNHVPPRDVICVVVRIVLIDITMTEQFRQL